MQKNDDKVGNITTNKEGKKESERGRSKIDSRKITINFGLCACVEDKKAVWLHHISRKIYLFFLQNSFLAILTLISRKLVQRRGIGEKCGFFATRRPSPKGQEVIIYVETFLRLLSTVLWLVFSCSVGFSKFHLNVVSKWSKHFFCCVVVNRASLSLHPFQLWLGAPNVNFRKISVRKTFLYPEFSEHLL